MKFWIRALIILSLVAGSTLWVGSVSLQVRVPETIYKLVGLEPEAPRIFGAKLPFRATELGVLWRGEGEPPELRTGRDGRSWRPWQRLEADPDMFDGEKGTHYSSLVSGQRSRFVQVRAPKGIQKGSLRVSAINTTDGPRRVVPLVRSASAATGKPDVVPRAAWGADESMRGPGGDFTRVRKIFLHHTATPNKDADPAGTLRAIYSYHVKTRGFHDIGYNFIIDHRGRIYEGRYAGPVKEGHSPSGEDENGSSVLGAHTKDHNAGSIGIAMLGNADAAAPSDSALDSLVGLAAWAADRHGIDPMGKFLQTDAHSGETETLFNIAGHKDARASITHCPGVILHAKLPSIRQRVEQTIAASTDGSPPSMPTGTVLTVAAPSLSLFPNASGDVSRATRRVDLMFIDSRGGVRTLSVAPQSGSFALTDADYENSPLAPGIYTVKAVAFDAQGRSSPPAQVANGYPVRRPPEIPVLDGLLPGGGSSEEQGPSDIAKAIKTVMDLLGL